MRLWPAQSITNMWKKLTIGKVLMVLGRQFVSALNVKSVMLITSVFCAIFCSVRDSRNTRSQLVTCPANFFLGHLVSRVASHNTREEKNTSSLT